MEKTKLLTISVIGLLLLNAGTLGFLLWSGPKEQRPPHNRPTPREMIIEQLHLDVTQQKAYDKLIQWHRTTIDSLDERIRHTKNELYSGLGEAEIDEKAKDSLLTLLNGYQKQIETTHFQHFEAIKKLCKPEQLEDYNRLTMELSRIFAPKPHRPPHD
ncbi:hypothetical protein [Flavobacterium sp.]|uniref:hypothetical protein n=1 Tax=Flavobacterium sp. TaxID=239 RepID=UPI002FDCC241